MCHSRWALSCFFHGVIGLPQETMGRLPAFSHELQLLAGQFSRLQIFRYVPASKFARPPDRSYRCNTPQGSRGFYVRAYRALLPPHAPDMLIGGRYPTPYQGMPGIPIFIGFPSRSASAPSLAITAHPSWSGANSG